MSVAKCNIPFVNGRSWPYASDSKKRPRAGMLEEAGGGITDRKQRGKQYRDGAERGQFIAEKGILSEAAVPP